MRILTVVSNLGPGGTQRVAESCALGYKRLGQESAVLSYDRGGCRTDRLIEQGVSVFTGGDRPGEVEKALRSANEWSPDVVHIHRTGYREKRSGIIIQSLASAQRKIVETNVFARFDSSKQAQLIDVHLVLSDWCLWKYQMWARRARVNPLAVVVPNPVASGSFYPSSAEERHQVRREWSIPDDAAVYGRVGQPNPAKWSLGLLSEFEKLAKRKQNVYLVLFGAPPEYQERASKLDDEIRNRVRLFPFIYGDEQLRRCYGAFDIFVHVAEIGESFGMVLCEAMLCGVPVITLATPCKDNSQVEVVGHGRGGLVVRNIRNLAGTMELLLNDVAMRQRLAAEAPQWVTSRFDVSIVMPRLLAVVQAMVKAPSRDALRRVLENELGLNTAADWNRLSAECSLGIGNPPPMENLLRKAVHAPLVYAAWERVKRYRLR